jgi:hypothetical protein
VNFKTIDMKSNPKKSDPGPQQWEVYGRCYDSTMPNEYCEDSILLPEQTSNLHMGPKPFKKPTSRTDSEEFGKPVDADLAVHLIKRSYGTVTGILDNDRLLKSLVESEEELSKDDIDKIKNAVINILYGVTFDKTVILKILSQPNCEGIRSYFCARKDGHLSLVLVGVDACGFDLNYEPKYALNEPGASDPPPNNSLIVEYGYPPGGSGVIDNESRGGQTKFDPHYVLLNYINTIKP